MNDRKTWHTTFFDFEFFNSPQKKIQKKIQVTKNEIKNLIQKKEFIKKLYEKKDKAINETLTAIISHQKTDFFKITSLIVKKQEIENNYFKELEFITKGIEDLSNKEIEFQQEESKINSSQKRRWRFPW